MESRDEQNERPPLKNAVFKDNIPQGTSLNKDSIKVYYLEVDVNGNVTRGAEAEPTDYNIISSDGSKLEIAFKDSINKAYQIEYATKITDENIKSFRNNVTITSDNQKATKRKFYCNGFSWYTLK